MKRILMVSNGVMKGRDVRQMCSKFLASNKKSHRT